MLVPRACSAVPGQQNPTLLKPAENLCIPGLPQIDNIIAEDSQPLCQFPQHAVGGKTFHDKTIYDAGFRKSKVSRRGRIDFGLPQSTAQV
jgi:hypothetical protein